MEWEWYGVPEMFMLWVHLIFSANIEDREWKGIIIPRGSLVTGRKQLAKDCGISEQQVRTCLTRLENNQQITIKTTNKYSIITICKYDDYQVSEKQEQPAVKTEVNQQITNKQPQDKSVRNIYITKLTNAPARTREEDWRYVSSVRRTLLNNDADKIAEYRRDAFRAEAEALAPTIGMTPAQTDAFVRYWTEHSKGYDRIRANNEQVFDTETRMRGWMDRDRQRGVQAAQRGPAAPKTRLEQAEDNMKYINDYFDGQPGNTDPDEQ